MRQQASSRGESPPAWLHQLAIDRAHAAGAILIGAKRPKPRRPPAGIGSVHAIVWGLATYAAAGVANQWEHQARFGYRTGIALALHLPKGRHFYVGVDRDQAMPRSQPEVARRVAKLSLFALHAQEAALQLLAPDGETEITPVLSGRELESLRWTMEGKTAWEVGCILGISEQTAVRHLNNATHKLGCVSKHQAVVKALRRGLLR